MPSKKKIEIVSITYTVDGNTHVMKPVTKPATEVSGLTNCNPGDTRCVNHLIQRCIDIGDGQCQWMVTSEPC